MDPTQTPQPQWQTSQNDATFVPGPFGWQIPLPPKQWAEVPSFQFDQDDFEPASTTPNNNSMSEVTAAQMANFDPFAGGVNSLQGDQVQTSTDSTPSFDLPTLDSITTPVENKEIIEGETELPSASFDTTIIENQITDNSENTAWKPYVEPDPVVSSTTDFSLPVTPPENTIEPVSTVVWEVPTFDIATKPSSLTDNTSTLPSFTEEVLPATIPSDSVDTNLGTSWQVNFEDTTTVTDQIGTVTPETTTELSPISDNTLSLEDASNMTSIEEIATIEDTTNTSDTNETLYSDQHLENITPEDEYEEKTDNDQEETLDNSSQELPVRDDIEDDGSTTDNATSSIPETSETTYSDQHLEDATSENDNEKTDDGIQVSPTTTEEIPTIAVSESPEEKDIAQGDPLQASYQEFIEIVDQIMDMKQWSAFDVIAHRTDDQTTTYNFSTQENNYTVLKHDVQWENISDHILSFNNTNTFEASLNGSIVDMNDPDIIYYIKDKLNKFITILRDEQTKLDKELKENKEKRKETLELLRSF